MPLQDPDGDGTYTGSQEVFKYVPGAGPGAERTPLEVPVRILQGTEETAARYPADTGTVIKDFGLVSLGGDRTFEASVSFGEGGTTAPIGGTTGPAEETAASVQYENAGSPEQAGVDVNEDGVVSEADGVAAARVSASAEATTPEEGVLPATGSFASRAAKVLPSTGGIPPVAAATGALLVVGGLVARKIFR